MKTETATIKRVLEAALLSTQQALSLSDLKKLFEGELSGDTLRRLLTDIRDEWEGQAVELVQVASGWRFRTRAEFLPYLERISGNKGR